MKPLYLEDLEEPDDFEFDAKEVSLPDPREAILRKLQQCGIEAIEAYHYKDASVYDGRLHRSKYQALTKEGRRIEVADLVHAQHIVWEIRKIPGVSRASVNTEPLPNEGYAGPWRTVRFWVSWNRSDHLREQARRIVDNLTEATSTSLELASRATRWLYQNHRELFRIRRSEAASILQQFLKSQNVSARLVTGYVTFGTQKAPHVWLNIQGTQYDPVYALQSQGPRPDRYETAPLKITPRNHSPIVQQLQMAVVRPT